MKKLLLILTVLISTTGFSQSLSLTEDTTLPLQGGNCGNGQTTNFTYEDVNLNNYVLTLRNVNLQITRNLNGSGEIIRCGNFDHSSVCVAGVIQNSPNLNGLTCNTLALPKFAITPRTIGLKYRVFDMLSREIDNGKVTEDFYRDLPESGFIIVVVEGYEPFKKFR